MSIAVVFKKLGNSSDLFAPCCLDNFTAHKKRQKPSKVNVNPDEIDSKILHRQNQTNNLLFN